MANEVQFRCREDSGVLGVPERAKPCGCGRQVVDKNDGYCITCGHLAEQDIDRAWDQQAWNNRKSQRRSSPRPFREHSDGRVYRMVFDSEAAA